MRSDLVSIIGSATLSTFNPSLLAAVGVMLLLPHPERLMLGYLLGAYLTSLAVGFAVVFWLHGTGIVTTSRHTLGPGGDILVGGLAVGVSLLLATGGDARLRTWRARRKEQKAAASESRDAGRTASLDAGATPSQDKGSWQLRLLGKGSTGMTFLVGAVLSFPGVSYLSALHHIVRLNPGAVPAILLVVFFCMMQQLLIELPLIGYAVAPDATPRVVSRSRDWLRRRGRRIAVMALGTLGILLIIRGVIAFGG